MMLSVRLFSWLFLSIYTLSVSTVLAQEKQSAVRDIHSVEISERQMVDAIASRTLTWLTGNSASNDYQSIGRLANYFGFVGLRVASGHTLKRSDVAKDTLRILDDKQRSVLIKLLTAQQPIANTTAKSRQLMNRLLEDLLIDQPVTQEQFNTLARAYGSAEAELGYTIAQHFGELAQTLTTNQKTQLRKIRRTVISGNSHQLKREKLKLPLPREEKKALENVAARFLSWTTGNPQYNDFEVVGKPGQHFGFVNLRIQSNHGVTRGGVAKEVLGLLTPLQRQVIAKAANDNLHEFTRFLDSRAQLLRSLEVALDGKQINLDAISILGAKVGEAEAKLTWTQAMAMKNIQHSMTETQASELLQLRDKYIVPATAALAADPVEHGRRLYAQCTLCHNSVNTQTIGPDLLGIVGRDVASDNSFTGYSAALNNFAARTKRWTDTALLEFLASPGTVVPGTTMGFTGFANPQDRQALLAYLRTLK